MPQNGGGRRLWEDSIKELTGLSLSTLLRFADVHRMHGAEQIRGGLEINFNVYGPTNEPKKVPKCYWFQMAYFSDAIVTR